MGEIHDLVRRDGASGAAAATGEPRAVAVAAGILADAAALPGYHHAGFASTALPHRETGATRVTRDGGGVRLRVEAGRDRNDVCVGLPYGAIARLILIYLSTAAVRARSREIYVGDTLHEWLRSAGLPRGGRTYSAVRDQFRRVALCNLRLFTDTECGEHTTGGGFLQSASLPAADGAPRWSSVVRLDELYFNSLVAHPLPFRLAAVEQIRARSVALDVYVWLAYRLHHLERPLRLPWPAVASQFSSYSKLRQFRAAFTRRDGPLSIALAAYEEARVESDERSLTLFPSPPPVRPTVKIGRTKPRDPQVQSGRQSGRRAARRRFALAPRPAPPRSPRRRRCGRGRSSRRLWRGRSPSLGNGERLTTR